MIRPTHIGGLTNQSALTESYAYLVPSDRVLRGVQLNLAIDVVTIATLQVVRAALELSFIPTLVAATQQGTFGMRLLDGPLALLNLVFQQGTASTSIQPHNIVNWTGMDLEIPGLTTLYANSYNSAFASTKTYCELVLYWA